MSLICGRHAGVFSRPGKQFCYFHLTTASFDGHLFQFDGEILGVTFEAGALPLQRQDLLLESFTQFRYLLLMLSF